ncbi:uncharacterized protein LOC129881416 isoform X2 [Solanum dulcamara]|uniref:uncharacterized protein LOC129881416 isoform X2 n=1 Tax=Solanum dulcamara TaxID=45834 RepID=UPI0024851A47|nr:uncharacterized protein LOC129881416 isoform X2 [Solanum dulcamara]
MKREYEGENILLQSLAQRDDPVQQMNSHEAGTLWKKGMTYSRKVLPKGTTSTIPSTSAFPTSSTPAIEDRSKAENQVASDDTPISTFDKDGVGGTSLANTRSKTSDVIEPPNCPVKFENLEDFFARVSGQIKRVQSLVFSADQSSPID